MGGGVLNGVFQNDTFQCDATMILIGFRHGLRVSELCDLQWSSIAFETGTMHVRSDYGQLASTFGCRESECRTTPIATGPT